MKYDYKLKYSSRKSVSLKINENGEIIVYAPYSYPESSVEKLLNDYSKWIDKAINRQNKAASNKISLSDSDIAILKDMANSVLNLKTAYYADIMGVKYDGVKITSAQKRFGSCSGSNHICYSYILMLYPDMAIDYVVVHELAHTVHHNHSKDFYDFVRKFMPNYKDAEKLLKGKQKLPY